MKKILLFTLLMASVYASAQSPLNNLLIGIRSQKNIPTNIYANLTVNSVVDEGITYLHMSLSHVALTTLNATYTINYLKDGNPYSEDVSLTTPAGSIVSSLTLEIPSDGTSFSYSVKSHTPDSYTINGKTQYYTYN